MCDGYTTSDGNVTEIEIETRMLVPSDQGFKSTHSPTVKTTLDASLSADCLFASISADFIGRYISSHAPLPRLLQTLKLHIKHLPSKLFITQCWPTCTNTTGLQETGQRWAPKGDISPESAVIYSGLNFHNQHTDTVIAV